MHVNKSKMKYDKKYNLFSVFWFIKAYVKYLCLYLQLMIRRGKQESILGQANQLRPQYISEQMQEYVQFLRTQIRQLGSQIDFEFERASELIFSLYKHLYSPVQCEGQKATLLNKLSGYGVQWNIPSQFEARPEEPQVRSQEARSSMAPTFTDAKDVENNKRAYNIRAKNKPQKYRYGEEEYDYVEKIQRADPPRRGRPSTKRDPDQIRRQQTNPYEKAPYKKRKSYVGDTELKQESPLREEPGRSSGKWDSDEQKEENGGQSLKNIQSEGIDLDKDGNQNQGVENREEAGILLANGEPYESYKANDTTISELVESYRRFMHAPKLLLFYEPAE